MYIYVCICMSLPPLTLSQRIHMKNQMRKMKRRRKKRKYDPIPDLKIEEEGRGIWKEEERKKYTIRKTRKTQEGREKNVMKMRNILEGKRKKTPRRKKVQLQKGTHLKLKSKKKEMPVFALSLMGKGRGPCLL